MILIEETKSKNQFIEESCSTFTGSKEHVERVREQCKNITLLKEILKSSEVTVQVDFAENYVCHYAEEISSVYYSKKQVTIVTVTKLLFKIVRE